MAVHGNDYPYNKCIMNIFRNPTPTYRPGFRKILLSLLENEEDVLSIPFDVGSNSLAAILGGPLDAGFNMYTELQTKYYGNVTTAL